ncbi:MAG: RDD family protein [Aequoribacter sp.]|uniref:RDD family protein n=1 Tax=Aequoribacter sp. TaxID=2847771 RepID=UPI003C3399F7
MSAPIAPPFHRHLLALVYDTFLVIPIIMASTALVMGLYVQIIPVDNTTEVVALPPGVVQLTAVLSVAIFYFIFWRRGGQTLGMQAWRVKLVNASGLPVSNTQILLRLMAATVSYGALGLGLAWRFIDRDRCYLHDRLSGTRLATVAKAH